MRKLVAILGIGMMIANLILLPLGLISVVTFWIVLAFGAFLTWYIVPRIPE